MRRFLQMIEEHMIVVLNSGAGRLSAKKITEMIEHMCQELPQELPEHSVSGSIES